MTGSDRRAVSAVAAGLCGALPAAAEPPAGPPYSIRPSEVKIPGGVETGRYQRVIRPFENWTLICDENLSAKEKVCNVTQTIEDRNGALAFSWSLAATRQGEPHMILRTAPNAQSDGPLSLAFDGRDQAVEVRLDGCNRRVCVAVVPVGPVLREQIARETSPSISYRTGDGATIRIETTLEGLSAALEAIE